MTHALVDEVIYNEKRNEVVRCEVSGLSAVNARITLVGD